MAVNWAAFAVVITAAALVCGTMWKLLLRLEGRFTGLESRFDRFEETVAGRFVHQGELYSGALDRLGAELTRTTAMVDHRLDRIDHRLDRVDHRLDGVEQGLGALRGDLAAHVTDHPA